MNAEVSAFEYMSTRYACETLYQALYYAAYYLNSYVSASAIRHHITQLRDEPWRIIHWLMFEETGRHAERLLATFPSEFPEPTTAQWREMDYLVMFGYMPDYMEAFLHLNSAELMRRVEIVGYPPYYTDNPTWLTTCYRHVCEHWDATLSESEMRQRTLYRIEYTNKVRQSQGAALYGSSVSSTMDEVAQVVAEFDPEPYDPDVVYSDEPSTAPIMHMQWPPVPEFVYPEEEAAMRATVKDRDYSPPPTTRNTRRREQTKRPNAKLKPRRRQASNSPSSSSSSSTVIQPMGYIHEVPTSRRREPRRLGNTRLHSERR